MQSLLRKPGWLLLLAVLALLAYLIFTVVFTLLFRYSTTALPTPPSPTAAATVTPTNTTTPLPVEGAALPTATPPSLPTATEPPPTTSPLPATAIPTATATATPEPPAVESQVVVNIRSGPGTNYPVVSRLTPGQPRLVTGQNEAGSWWQVTLPEGGNGWVADSVVSRRGPVAGVAIAQAPPPPPPTATPIPPTPTEPPRPQFQFEPTGWYGDTNYGLTRFLGNITDVNGNPVNGYSIEAQCGSFRIISNPSGPVGWPPFYDSAGDPDGFYDVTLDRRPIPCKWFLTVVQSPDGKTVSARLSDAIEVETTIDETIVTANWRKNW